MCSIPLVELQQILKQHLILNRQLWSAALIMYICRLADRIGKSYCTMLHGISSYFALPRDILIKMFVLFYRVTGEGLLLLAVVNTDW